LQFSDIMVLRISIVPLNFPEMGVPVPNFEFLEDFFDKKTIFRQAEIYEKGKCLLTPPPPRRHCADRS